MPLTMGTTIKQSNFSLIFFLVIIFVKYYCVGYIYLYYIIKKRGVGREGIGVRFYNLTFLSDMRHLTYVFFFFFRCFCLFQKRVTLWELNLLLFLLLSLCLLVFFSLTTRNIYLCMFYFANIYKYNIRTIHTKNTTIQLIIPPNLILFQKLVLMNFRIYNYFYLSFIPFNRGCGGGVSIFKL